MSLCKLRVTAERGFEHCLALNNHVLFAWATYVFQSVLKKVLLFNLQQKPKFYLFAQG
jgi:hypothetical protein